MCAKADNTNKKYLQSYKRFETFCKQRGIMAKSANSIHVSLYLTYLMDHKASYSIISSAVYGMKWMHEMNNYEDPTKHNFIKRLLEAAKRLRSFPVKKKDVITTDLLITLCSMYDTDDILYLRNICIILIGFAGFLEI